MVSSCFDDVHDSDWFLFFSLMTNVYVLEGIDTFLFVKKTVLSLQFIREKIKKKEH